ncbi:MAG: ribbon-helix-helix domain-containing protein [Deltaproteobacteria bacterium]|nr:ribbon-helix-helix domain-containing protein [Deltaproteobacteria bacterium]
MREPMRTISLKIPARLDRLLTVLARRRGTSRSAVLREALDALAGIEEHSFAAGAADLAGRVEGPSDLSTSERHLEGFGE